MGLVRYTSDGNLDVIPDQGFIRITLPGGTAESLESGSVPLGVLEFDLSNASYLLGDDPSTGTIDSFLDQSGVALQLSYRSERLATPGQVDLSQGAAVDSDGDGATDVLYFTYGGLWRTDGTVVGTREVCGWYPRELLAIGSRLYFATDTAMWSYDGSGVPQQITTGLSLTRISHLTNVNGTLFFVADDGTGLRVWTSNGTAAGTKTIKSLISNGKKVKDPIELVSAIVPEVIGEQVVLVPALFLLARDDVQPDMTRLWQFNVKNPDGTLADADLVAAAPISSALYNPDGLMTVRDGPIEQIYFIADDNGTNNTRKLWRRNASGNDVETVQFLDGENPVDVTNPVWLETVDTMLFYVSGNDLWKVSNQYAESVRRGFATSPTFLTVVNDRLYFVADGGTFGVELWTSKEGHTELVRDINVARSGDGCSPSHLVNVNGTLYFSADDDIHGRELWRTHYDPERGHVTGLVENIRSEDGSDPQGLAALGNWVYFTAADGSGRNLWKSRLAPQPDMLPTDDTLRIDQHLGMDLQVSVLDAEADLRVTEADSTGHAMVRHQYTLRGIRNPEGVIDDEGLNTMIKQAVTDAFRIGTTRITVRLELPDRIDGIRQDNVRLDVDAGRASTESQFVTAEVGNEAGFSNSTRLLFTPLQKNSVFADIYDDRGGAMAERVSQIDLRHFGAGTYYMRVYRSQGGFGERVFAIDVAAPPAGQTRARFEDPDRDVIHGGDGDDFILGNQDVDRIFGGTGTDTFVVDSITDPRIVGTEVRDLEAAENDLAHVVEPPASETGPEPRHGAPKLDPIVEIADPGLRFAIASQLGIPITERYDGTPQLAYAIHASQMAGLTRLDLGNFGIGALSGLENAINLRSLNLANNDVPNLTALAKRTSKRPEDAGSPLGPSHLEYLAADGNQIADVAPLADLKELQFLSIDRIDIVSTPLIADIGPLAGLARLDMLSLANQAVADVRPLAELPSMQIVDLRNNLIGSIDSLLGQTIVDNFDSDYDEYGQGWTGDKNPNAFEGDYRILPGQLAAATDEDGNLNYVKFTFEHLPADQYDVLATWPEHESRTREATYTISVLGAEHNNITGQVLQYGASRTFNQRFTPDKQQVTRVDSRELGGRKWALVHSLDLSNLPVGSTVIVALTGGANDGNFAADAVRLERAVLPNLTTLDLRGNPLDNAAHEYVLSAMMNERPGGYDAVANQNLFFDADDSAPVIATAIGPQSTEPGVPINIENIVAYDPDGDPVFITGYSSDEDNVHVAVDGDGPYDVTITPEADFVGSVTVTLVAQDGPYSYGDRTSRTTECRFDVNVGRNAIYGVNYDDINGNGPRDGEDSASLEYEPPIEGWTIYLDQNDNGQFDEGEDPVTVTDVNGAYSFTELIDDSYVIGEMAEADFLQTFPSSGSTQYRDGSWKLNDRVVNGGKVSGFKISEDGAWVVYRADQDTDNAFELYSVPIAGGTAMKLNDRLVGGGDVAPIFEISPDGSRVVYRSDQDTDDVYELYSVPIAGGTGTKLNDRLVGGGDVGSIYEISPDGSRVVYRSDQDTDNVYELYSVPIAGGIATKLNGALVGDGDVLHVFEISPDSSRVVYRADQDTDDVNELYSVPIAGGNAVKLTVGDVAEFQVSAAGSRVVYRRTGGLLCSVPITGGAPVMLSGFGDIVDDFELSENGNWVVYRTINQESIPPTYDVYFVPVDGGAAVFVATASGGCGGGIEFKISADGNWVVYQVSDGSCVEELYSKPVAGGPAVKLHRTLLPIDDVAEFEISADSEWVVYRSNQETHGSLDLYSVPIAGGPLMKLNGTLVAGGEVDYPFEISVDSSRVIYRADQDMDGTHELYSVPIAGGTAVKLNRTLVTGGDVQSDFEISADGTRVVYRADQDRNSVFELYSVATKKWQIVSDVDFGNFRVVDGRADQRRYEGQAADLAGMVYDPNPADGHNITATWNITREVDPGFDWSDSPVLTFQENSKTGVWEAVSIPSQNFEPSDEGVYNVTLTVTDNDNTDANNVYSDTFQIYVEKISPKQIELLRESDQIDEQGVATYLVRLSRPPLAKTPVHIRRVSGDESIDVVAGEFLEFTPDNWDKYQKVRFAAGDDENAVGETTVFEAYSPGWEILSFSITENDNERYFILRENALVVPEGGAAGLWVKLGGRPNVPLKVTASHIGGQTDVTVVSPTLTISPDKWEQWHPIAFSSTQNDGNAIDGKATYELTADTWTTASFTVSEEDDDQIIQANTAILAIDENGEAVWRVRLEAQPAENVVVHVSLAHPDAPFEILEGAELTFTTLNWAEEQEVRFASLADDDTIDDSVFAEAAAEGWVPSAVVLTQDDDHRILLVDLDERVVEEDGEVTVGVRLLAPPQTEVIVSAALTGDPSFSITPLTSLTFTQATWSQFQYVTITAADDGDARDGTATLRFTATDWEDATVSLTEADNDRRIVVSSEPISVREGQEISFDVWLSAKPEGDVIVTAAWLGGDIDVGVTRGSQLTFTTGNWDQPQQVTVSARDDANIINDITRLSLSADNWQSNTAWPSKRSGSAAADQTTVCGVAQSSTVKTSDWPWLTVRSVSPPE
jgi:ELWxxDGT repeat protein